MTEAIEVFQKLAAAEYAPAFGTQSEAASERQMRLAAHRTWLRSIPHEIPNPEHAYRGGIYIRYFNQTRYDNYLDYHISTPPRKCSNRQKVQNIYFKVEITKFRKEKPKLYRMA